MAGGPYGVIFDMDGVLADTARPHFESWQMAGRELGFEMTEELFHETFGMTNQKITPILYGRPATDGEVADVIRVKEGYYREIVADELVPVPGVVDFIRDLESAGLRMAVGSSGPLENVRLVVGALGVADAFDAVVSGEDVVHGKPDPEVFLIAAEKLGLDAATCLVVEDAPVGIRAALAAGMKCLAVTVTHRAALLRDAHVVRDDFVGFSASDAVRLIGGRQ